MIVTYLKENGQVISIIEGFPKVWEENNQLLIENGSCPVLNDLSKTGWGYYKDKIIVRDEDDIEVPLYLADLDLEPMDADDLPISEHIGKLKAINPAQAKPATVTRRFGGENYDVACLVTQSVAELYQDVQIQVDDFVLVSFFEDIPNTGKRIAIVTDKVYKSW